MKKLILVLPIALAITLLSGCNTDNTGKDYVSCTEKQKNAQACTTEYMPVCGQDGVTYGNICDACLHTDSYKIGECKCSDSSQTCDMGDMSNTSSDSETDIEGSDLEMDAEGTVLESDMEGSDNSETTINVPTPNFE